MMSGDSQNLAYWRALPPMRITMDEAMALPEYSASNPTGVHPGKRWRRHNGAHDFAFKARGGVPRWVICTYEAIAGDDTRVRNGTYRPVVRVKVPFVWGPCSQCTEMDVLDCASWKSCQKGQT